MRGVLPDSRAARGTLGAQVGALAGVGGCDEHQTGQGEPLATARWRPRRGVGRPAHSPTVTARSPGVAGWTLLAEPASGRTYRARIKGRKKDVYASAQPGDAVRPARPLAARPWSRCSASGCSTRRLPSRVADPRDARPTLINVGIASPSSPAGSSCRCAGTSPSAAHKVGAPHDAIIPRGDKPVDNPCACAGCPQVRVTEARV